MKKLLFIFTLCMVSLVASAAMPYDYSTFFASSATGSGVLEKAASGTVFTWYYATTNLNGTNPTIGSSTLSYTDANSAKYIDNNAGSAITLASVPSTPTPAARSSVFYLTSTGLAIGTTYYTSVLINISAAPTSAVKILNLNNSSTGNSAYGTVQIKGLADNSGFQLAVQPGAGATISAYSQTYSYNTPHLIVLKYVFTSLSNTDSYLFIDPSFGAEGSPTVSGLNNTVTAVTAIKGLVITQNLNLTGTVAGLRFGTSWADVVKGKLATPSVATGASPITSSGFTANWATVSNASSYTLTVYNSNGTTNQTITGISNAVTTYDVIGLSPSTSYSYKVTAVGNGTTLSTSDQSTAATFNTIASAVPVLSVDAISGSFGGQAINTTTGPNSFNISGSLLTTANLTVDALSGFSYSTTSGGTYTSSLSVPQTGGSVSQQIFVKFTPTSYASYSGNIVVGGGGAASSVNCAVTGSGIYAEPTTQASAVTFSSISGTGFTVNWTAGNGANSIVLVKSASAVDNNPADATSYTANTAFNSGSLIGTANYVLYNGTGNSVAITGLTKGTKYYVSVYSFNGSGGAENYLISSSASGNQLAANTITSNGTGGGTWADGLSWNGGTAPGQLDNVNVLSSDVIDVTTASQKCNNLYIDGKVWANTAAQTLSVYGTYLVCNGTFGASNNALTTGSQLILAYGNIIDITGNGGIYPYKIQPVTGMTPIGVTFDANVTATYGTAGVQTDNTGNTNVTLTVSAGKTLTVPGNMTPGGSATALCSGNVIIDVYGTINITGTLNTTAAVGKTSTLTVYDKGLITTGKFNLSPPHQVQAATYTVNSGGEIRVTGTSTTAVDCSHATITSYVTGGGTFSTTSAGSTVALGNASGLDASTGPIRTSTRSFDAATNFSFVGTVAQVPGGYFPSSINGLTINNAAGVTLGGSTTVNGNLALTTGTLTIGANTLTLSGSKSGTGIIDGASGTIIYNGSIAQTSSTLVNVNNLTINNAAGVTLGANVSAATTIINASGILIVDAGKQLTVSSSLTNSGTANINGSIQLEEGSSVSGNNLVYGTAGTLILNNSSRIYLWGTPAFWPTTSGPVNVTVQNTGGIELQVARTVTGVFQTAAGVKNTFGNDLTVSGTVRMNSGAYFDNFSPTYSGSGTLEYNTSGTYGTSNEWGAGSSVGYGVPQNVTVTNTTTVNLSGARTIPGTLTLTSGSLNNSSNGLTLGDGATVITSAGTLSAVPTFGTSVNLTYTGTSVKGNEFPASDIINTLTANNTAGISLADNRTIPTLSIGSGSSVSVAAGKQLTVSTTLTNNSGTLNLLSDASGTATIITPETLGGTGGTYSVNQYLTSGATGTSGRNWYISSPVASALSSTITTATGNGLVSYNVGTGGWDAAGTTMDVLKGYIAKSPAGNPTITFSGGSLNTSAQSASNLPIGFNLVGNPYASYVDWNQASKTNLNPTMWYRSKEQGTYKFYTFNGTAAGYGGGVVGVPANVSNIIPPMQAFWVKAEGGVGSFGFTNTMRSHLVGTNPLKAPAATESVQQLLRLEVSNAENTDEAVVYFNANATDGYDAFDSPKRTNANASIPEIYTTVGGEQLVINGLKAVTPNKELALGFNTGSANNFTIKASEVSNFDADTKIILKDNVLNTEWNLTGGSAYGFTSDATNTSTRFTVIFRTTGAANGIESYNYDYSSLNIFKNANNQITIQRNFSENATVTVCNAIGQKLISTQMAGTNKVIDKTFSAGVYFVTVNVAGNKTTKKLIIN